MKTLNSSLLIIAGLLVLYLAVTGGLARLIPGLRYIVAGTAPSTGAGTTTNPASGTNLIPGLPNLPGLSTYIAPPSSAGTMPTTAPSMVS